MKRIPLTQGKFALVDDEDFDRLNKYKWHAQKGANTYYAERSTAITGLYDTVIGRLGCTKRILVKMSRQVLGLCKDDPRIVDHKSRDGLDNQKENLRPCTNQQNIWNRAGHGEGKYKGVYWSRGKWIVMCNRKWVGTFEVEIVAAKAYDLAAIESFGEFAYLNFPLNDTENADSENTLTKSAIAT